MTWMLFYLMMGQSSGPASLTSGTISFRSRQACEAAAEQIRADVDKTRRVQVVVTCFEI